MARFGPTVSRFRQSWRLSRKRYGGMRAAAAYLIDLSWSAHALAVAPLRGAGDAG